MTAAAAAPAATAAAASFALALRESAGRKHQYQ
jgi:hypothetical protein